jgi:UDP-N-acetylmuramoyl-tripeptide--D-alanyl-D-alanine ligase
VSDGFWTDLRVRQALGLEGGDSALGYDGVTTDTRAVADGDLFVALKGDRFDGHEFLDHARRSGARGAVVSDPPTSAPEGLALYTVEDTLTALARLAAHRRDSIGATFIGVVGSNGKTTTKELTRAVLAERFQTYATEGNLNNQIGVPLTLLRMPADTEMAVIEMGTNRPGEISLLTAIVRPDHVIITSIGEEHLELLGDLEGVLREEISVLEGLAPKGRVFLAEEPDALSRKAREMVGRKRIKTAGLGEGSDLRPDGGERGIHVMEDGSTLWRWRGLEVRLPIPGRFNVRNALLALGVAVEVGIHPRQAIGGLADVKLPKLRGEWVRYGELKILADCYNANPPSVAAAIDLLGTLPTRGRRLAVLGTMRELGENSERLHAVAADRIARLAGSQIDVIVATGEFVPAFEKHRARLGEQLVAVTDPVEAFRAVAPSLRPTDTILLKASRGDRLERWVDLLGEQFGAEGSSTTNSQ